MLIGLATLTAALLWSAIAGWLVPDVIRAAYRGESLAVFNAIVKGQATHRVDDYLGRWAEIASKVRLLLLGAGAATAILTRSGVVAFFRRRRDGLVYSLFLILVGGHAVEIARGSGVLAPEHWPFSAYPMYAGVASGRTLVTPGLFGVPAAHPEDEIALTDPRYLVPFDRSRLAGALARLSMSRDPDALRDALKDCLVRYERLRTLGRHAGPRLRAVRLYRLRWPLDPAGAPEPRAPTKELRLAETAASPAD